MHPAKRGGAASQRVPVHVEVRLAASARPRSPAAAAARAAACAAARAAARGALAHRSIPYLDGPLGGGAWEDVRAACAAKGASMEDVRLVDCDTGAPHYGVTLFCFQTALRLAVYAPIDEREEERVAEQEAQAERDNVFGAGGLFGAGGGSSSGASAREELDDGSVEESPGARGDKAQVLAVERSLPSAQLAELWDSLHYGGRLKLRLLAHATSSQALARAGASTVLVRRSGLILLHGPPGSGKSSLAQALAQKLAVWHVGAGATSAGAEATLFELNAAAVMNKFFGESAKSLQKAFERVRARLRSLDDMAVVLVDEADALAISRAHSLSSADPGDATRVTGALLRELDALAELPNALCIATTNLEGDLDGAFVDRADMSVLVGNPELQARYGILRSEVLELARVGLIRGSPLLLPMAWGALDTCAATTIVQGASEGGGAASVDRLTEDEGEEQRDVSNHLLAVAQECEGASGRALRRLPLLAHAEARDIDSVAIAGWASVHSLIDSLHRAAQIANERVTGCKRANGV